MRIIFYFLYLLVVFKVTYAMDKNLDSHAKRTFKIQKPKEYFGYYDLAFSTDSKKIVCSYYEEQVKDKEENNIGMKVINLENGNEIKAPFTSFARIIGFDRTGKKIAFRYAGNLDGIVEADFDNENNRLNNFDSTNTLPKNDIWEKPKYALSPDHTILANLECVNLTKKVNFYYGIVDRVESSLDISTYKDPGIYCGKNKLILHHATGIAYSHFKCKYSQYGNNFSFKEPRDFIKFRDLTNSENYYFIKFDQQGIVIALCKSMPSTNKENLRDHAIELWDIQSEVPVMCCRNQSAHTKSIKDLAFSHSSIFASASEDGTIKVWKMPTYNVNKLLVESLDLGEKKDDSLTAQLLQCINVKSLGFSIDLPGHLIAYVTQDGTVSVEPIKEVDNIFLENEKLKVDQEDNLGSIKSQDYNVELNSNNSNNIVQGVSGSYGTGNYFNERNNLGNSQAEPLKNKRIEQDTTKQNYNVELNSNNSNNIVQDVSESYGAGNYFNERNDLDNPRTEQLKNKLTINDKNHLEQDTIKQNYNVELNSNNSNNIVQDVSESYGTDNYFNERNNLGNSQTEQLKNKLIEQDTIEQSRVQLDLKNVEAQIEKKECIVKEIENNIEKTKKDYLEVLKSIEEIDKGFDRLAYLEERFLETQKGINYSNDDLSNMCKILNQNIKEKKKSLEEKNESESKKRRELEASLEILCQKLAEQRCELKIKNNSTKKLEAVNLEPVQSDQEINEKMEINRQILLELEDKRLRAKKEIEEKEQQHFEYLEELNIIVQKRQQCLDTISAEAIEISSCQEYHRLPHIQHLQGVFNKEQDNQPPLIQQPDQEHQHPQDVFNKEQDRQPPLIQQPKTLFSKIAVTLKNYRTWLIGGSIAALAGTFGYFWGKSVVHKKHVVEQD